MDRIVVRLTLSDLESQYEITDSLTTMLAQLRWVADVESDPTPHPSGQGWNNRLVLVTVNLDDMAPRAEARELIDRALEDWFARALTGVEEVTL